GQLRSVTSARADRTATSEIPENSRGICERIYCSKIVRKSRSEKNQKHIHDRPRDPVFGRICPNFPLLFCAFKETQLRTPAVLPIISLSSSPSELSYLKCTNGSEVSLKYGQRAAVSHA